MTDAVRTPGELPDGLPGFPWAPRYRRVDGLRLAVEHRDRVDRLVIIDTGLVTGQEAMSEAFAKALGRPAPRVFERSGHFVQEDQGEEAGALIADWLSSD